MLFRHIETNLSRNIHQGVFDTPEKHRLLNHQIF